ncbi:sporulation-specific protein 2, partial [Scheffersomyces stipitis CBS 6054]
MFLSKTLVLIAVLSTSYSIPIPSEYGGVKEYIVPSEVLVKSNIISNSEVESNTNHTVDDQISVISRGSLPEYCKREHYSIKTPSDMKVIDECHTIVGNIDVSEYNHPLLSLGDIENIIGGLSVKKSPELVRLEAPALASISEGLVLTELTSLSLVSFPSLRTVKELEWRVLPILSNVYVSADINNIERITVSDSSLTEFSGFLSNKLEVLDINNNRFLHQINFNVEEVTKELHIAANQADVKVSLPRLKFASNVSIHEVADLNLNELELINGSASLTNNYFTQLKIPKLKFIGGTLSLLKNKMLNSVDFPLVTEIGGGLMLVNNTKVEKINFFPSLNVIGGAIEIVGNIKETSFKHLKLVKGSASIHSTSTSFDCAKWLKSDISSVIRGGKIECINANNEKVVANTPTEGNSTDEDSSYQYKNVEG